MVAIQQRGINEQLELGIKKAQEKQCSILVSYVQKVNNIDPLSFFAAGEHVFTDDRFFWSDPSRQKIIVGLGALFTYQSKDGHQLSKLEEEWERLIKHHVVNEKPKISGTGPVLVGGISFDPLKEKTNLWSNFPDTKMFLPKYSLTSNGDDTWLTINELVYPDDQPLTKQHMLMNEQRNVFKHTSDSMFDNIYNQDQTILDIEETDKEVWLDAVERTAMEIRDREIDKVVLARELRVKSNKPFIPVSILQRLRREQPTSYIFAVQSQEDCFLGASPERLVKRENNQFYSTCLAGSIERGKTAFEDDQLGTFLLNDDKNLHEHKLVVNMIKEAFEKSCYKVDVPNSPILYKVRDIQHLYTPVTGEPKEDVSLLTMVKHLHPTPALGGFPKADALNKIRDVEQLDRGWYAAPVGWMDAEGNGEFLVSIRSGLIQGNEVSLFAGCGIVGDSVPESEYKETNMKFRPMLSAIGGTGNEIK